MSVQRFIVFMVLEVFFFLVFFVFLVYNYYNILTTNCQQLSSCMLIFYSFYNNVINWLEKL